LAGIQVRHFASIWAMKLFIRCVLLFATATLCVLLESCGAKQEAQQPCFFTGMTISPANGVADHNAASPGNVQQFTATGTGMPAHCPVSNVAALGGLPSTWSVSDNNKRAHQRQRHGDLHGTNPLADDGQRNIRELQWWASPNCNGDSDVPVINAFSLGLSRSMRSRQSCVNSSGDIFLSRRS
jgi:hypothetical protein